MRARVIGGAALVISVAAHAVGLVQYGETPEQVAAESAPPMQAQFGTGFADMAAGTAVPVTPDVTEETEPEEVPPEPVEVTPEVTPVETELAEPVEVAKPEPVPVLPSPVVETAEAAPVEAPVLTQPATAAPAAPVAVGEAPPMTLAALAPLKPVEPTPPEEAAPPPPELIEALPETVVQTPDANDLRPVARPPDLARKPPPKEPPKKQPPRKPPPKPVAQRAGNADQDQTRGASTASAARAPAASAGQGQTSDATAATERKAAAAYPGKVNRKLRRTRKARARENGSAMVQFTIARNGGLASARILRSSGNPEIDKLALDHTRRASPFPAPPAGAQTTFNYEFVSKR